MAFEVQRKTLPQYDGESDPKKFLMNYEAVIKSNGGRFNNEGKSLCHGFEGTCTVLVHQHSEMTDNSLVPASE